MIDTNGKYYLGKQWDAATSKLLDDTLLYDSEDLTTHAVVVGMTGSGKTGLCVGLLEEAALNGVPALMVDPKGDLTNLLLHFPDLLPADFKPWINADAARKDGKTEDQAAAETAAMWQAGLTDWDIAPERIKALADSVRFTIYTPGSTAGVPLSVLSKLSAPDIPWQGNEELLQEQISGTVTALLGLIGLKDIDPVQLREHILLANIFETAWSQGQEPGPGRADHANHSRRPLPNWACSTSTRFFPEKERFDLAMLLNNVLASLRPSRTWVAGRTAGRGRAVV
jgi:hypothetical protein